jgi:hypothetical protein
VYLNPHSLARRWKIKGTIVTVIWLMLSGSRWPAQSASADDSSSQKDVVEQFVKMETEGGPA